MRAGPLIVGAAVGGLVWVLALRATSKATADGKQAGGPPPPDETTIRTTGGKSVETPPIIGDGPGDGPGGPATVDVISNIAATATDVQSINVAAPAGVDGNTGTIEPLITDPVTRTIRPDVDHPTGGQGTEQQSPTPAGQTPSYIPAYGDGGAPYEVYLRARLGSTNGMTPSQLAGFIREASRVGGLPG